MSNNVPSREEYKNFKKYYLKNYIKQFKESNNEQRREIRANIEKNINLSEEQKENFWNMVCEYGFR